MKHNIEKISKEEIKGYATDIAYVILGCIIMAVGFNVFQRPNDIVGGGVTGIAQVINYYTKFPIGVITVVLNLPLFYFGIKWLKRSTIVITIFSTTFLAVCYDLTTWLPAFTGDKFFAAILAGVVGGIGCGIIFMRGTTSGGSDLLNKLIRTKNPSASVGNLYMIINGFVVLLAAIVYGEVESAFYAIAALFAGGTIINRMISNVDVAKMVVVITNKGDEIAEEITRNMVRGVTLLDGEGAYSHEERTILICVVRRKEIYKLRSFITKVDPNSFIVFTEASEVWGRGFKLKDVV